MRRPARLAPVVLALAVPATADMARADFIACNDSFDVINLAVGQQRGGEFVTRGWWTIGPNRCATVIRELSTRFVYVHATDVFGQMLLAGDIEMCLAESRFEITGIEDCWRRGHVSAPFAEIDTGTAARWVLFLGAHEGG